MCFEHCTVPSRKIKWQVHALFVKDHELMNAHCLVESNIQNGNLVINLYRYLWEVSSLDTECIQIYCLEHAHVETVVPQ